MQRWKLFSSNLLALPIAILLSVPALALTNPQTGTSGKTYASGPQCALHPVKGMAPMAQAGLLNPKKNATAIVALNNNPVATVTFASPDATVWLDPQINSVAVALNPGTIDSYSMDTLPTYPGQLNSCIPDTRSNTITGDLEYAASSKSYATIPVSCALNPLTGTAQPFVNLFDNGSYLLNVSTNNVALTQLNGTTRTHAPVFLAAGMNVISAANGTTMDYYVRDGGSGLCTLP